MLLMVFGSLMFGASAQACLSDLPPHYEVRGGRVYFGSNEAPEKWPVVKDADAKTFVEIKMPEDKDEDPDSSCAGIDFGTRFGRDRKNVFFDGAIIPAADPASFVVFGWEYGKDKSSVYLRGKRVNGASPTDVTITEGRMLKSNGEFFCDGEKMNLSKLRELDRSLYADDQRICLSGEIHKVEDPLTLNYVGRSGFAKDAKAAYSLRGMPRLLSRKPASFKLLGDNYATDGEHVFHGESKVVGADPATFRYLKDGRAVDRHGEYLLGERTKPKRR